jgi:16S rRNA (guanine966-N2)-methyltransferase
VPEGDAIRPTADRVRESLFNILASRGVLDGARVLDAFAGTGALGIEALSRGAASATFLDNTPASLALISRNLAAFGLEADVQRCDATRPGAPKGALYDLIFLDPPYGKGLGEKATLALLDKGWLAPGALLVLEEAKGNAPNQIDGFEKHDERAFGETVIGFFVLLKST